MDTDEAIADALARLEAQVLPAGEERDLLEQLGSIGKTSDRVFAILIGRLSHPRADIRLTTCHALAAFGNPAAIEALRGLVDDPAEADLAGQTVGRWAKAAVEILLAPPPGSAAWVDWRWKWSHADQQRCLELLHHPNGVVRANSLRGLAANGDAATRAAIEALTGDNAPASFDELVSDVAIGALKRLERRMSRTGDEPPEPSLP